MRHGGPRSGVLHLVGSRLDPAGAKEIAILRSLRINVGIDEGDEVGVEEDGFEQARILGCNSGKAAGTGTPDPKIRPSQTLRARHLRRHAR